MPQNEKEKKSYTKVITEDLSKTIKNRRKNDV